MDPDKTRVICEWPIPRAKKQMQSFLGTCVYVLKFCPNFAELSAPLVEVTKGKTQHELLDLDSRQLKCFEQLKKILSSPPLLAHPDTFRPFHVRMDASDFAVGGYLFQIDDDKREHVIAYGGRKLNSAELMYPTREKELLAALHAMRLWRVYLIDKPFYINTDHKTLQSIVEQKTCSQRLARWLNEIGLYQPLFKWIPGSTNIVADFVSRNPAFEPSEPSHVISLASLINQLSAGISNADNEAGLLSFMENRPSALQQCKRMYKQDHVFGPLYSFLSSAANPKLYLFNCIRRFALTSAIFSLKTNYYSFSLSSINHAAFVSLKMPI